MSSELKLITPRRNFLIRALGFTAAGATLPIGIVAADDPAAHIAHHQVELEKAWRDYYGPGAVRTYADVRGAGRDLHLPWEGVGVYVLVRPVGVYRPESQLGGRKPHPHECS